jgi:predicted NAD/FAD-binding protein
VFNHVNYPHLVKLFDELDVPVAKSDMSFAASIGGGQIEYGLRSLGALFAQKGNLARPGFLRMVRDLMRFNAQAETMATDANITIGALMDEMRMGQWFRDHYLMPISGAIWSTPKEEIMDFPAQALVRFFRNHNLLQATGQHQWWTVQGGSIEYVNRLERAMRAKGVDIRLAAPIEAVKRDPLGVEILREGHWERFDEVVFATHSDDTLAMLADPTPQETAALGAVRYQPNTAVLHADARAMPKRRVTWSSWNYTERAGHEGGPIDLTYWMNCLQPIPESDPLFVTLNSRAPIDESLIYDTAVFRHPVYDLAALAAQGSVRAMNGDNNTWFCGAWMKNGFHEDGYASAIDVVEAMAARDGAAVAA